MQLLNILMPVIKWSGSKRSQAKEIVKHFPDYNTYYEPFIGGGSILGYLRPKKAICGDVCKPLIDLWNMIKIKPEIITKGYTESWNRLDQEGYQVYYEIRDRFNKEHMETDLLFLTRTCVNGLIRFNNNGEFNNSLHHTRKGIKPEKLGEIISDWHEVVQSANFYFGDYKEITKNIKKGDFLYLDPPYFNTKGRYYGTIDFDEFTEFLVLMNRKGVKYALSFDGKTKDRNYTVKFPKKLYKRHFYLKSGHSSFKKVIDKKESFVEESLYLNY